MKKCWCGNTALAEYSAKYYRCDKCHTLISKQDVENSIYNVENEEDDLYGKNYWEVAMVKATGKSTLSEVLDMYLTERVMYWLKYILKYVKLGSCVAEVGCGLGQLQYILKRIGFQQIAYELSPDVCNYMRDQLKIEVCCGSFEERNSVYDAIMALDLFEHLVDPLDFMEKCANSLKPGGILCFQTPCYDYSLNYVQMLSMKPRFDSLLVDDQHIFLYSKEAIADILRKYGFTHIVFEPAFFGDDYDMFFFASKTELCINTEQQIEDYLNATENGRLIKAMLKQFTDGKMMEAQFEEANANAVKHLEQIDKLTEQLEESEADRRARLEQINELTGLLKERETDCAARLEQVDALTAKLQEIEADRAARLEQTNTLTALLQESEADRAARLEQINTLTAMVKEIEADRNACLEQINTLTAKKRINLRRRT